MGKFEELVGCMNLNRLKMDLRKGKIRRLIMAYHRFEFWVETAILLYQ